MALKKDPVNMPLEITPYENIGMKRKLDIIQKRISTNKIKKMENLN